MTEHSFDQHIKDLLNEIAEYEKFTILLHQHQRAKVLELAESLLTIDEIRNSTSLRRYRKTRTILIQSRGPKLSKITMTNLHTALDHCAIATTHSTSLTQLLLTECIARSINNNPSLPTDHNEPHMFDNVDILL